MYIEGGCMPKEEALSVLRDMKYYDKNLEEIEEIKFDYTYIKGWEKEKYIVDKLLLVKNIVDNELPNEAIDAYLQTIEKKPSKIADKFIAIAGFFPVGPIADAIENLTHDLTEKQFKHYLDIYNTFYNIKNQ